tara:strand:- start:1005 stop:1193 length:189 start_codon:yes stop_codon:yes gene_type:complete
VLLSFVSNKDAVDLQIFGQDMSTWLIYTLIFLGLTAFGFLGTWIFGLLRDLKAQKPIQKPWD